MTLEELCHNGEDRALLEEALRKTGRTVEELVAEGTMFLTWALEHESRGERVVLRNDKLRRQHGIVIGKPPQQDMNREALSLYFHLREHLDKGEGWVFASLDEHDKVVAEFKDKPEYEYDLPGVASCLLSLIGGGAMAKPDELDAAISVIRKELGVGYYDGIGDPLLQAAVDFLEKMKAESNGT